MEEKDYERIARKLEDVENRFEELSVRAFVQNQRGQHGGENQQYGFKISDRIA